MLHLTVPCKWRNRAAFVLHMFHKLAKEGMPNSQIQSEFLAKWRRAPDNTPAFRPTSVKTARENDDGPKNSSDEYMITSMEPASNRLKSRQAHGTPSPQRWQKLSRLFSGISVVNAVHNHPKVIAACQSPDGQAGPLLHLRYYSPTAGRLARSLAVARRRLLPQRRRGHPKGQRLAKHLAKRPAVGCSTRKCSSGPACPSGLWQRPITFG